MLGPDEVRVVPAGKLASWHWKGLLHTDGAGHEAATAACMVREQSSVTLRSKSTDDPSNEVIGAGPGRRCSTTVRSTLISHPC